MRFNHPYLFGLGLIFCFIHVHITSGRHTIAKCSMHQIVTIVRRGCCLGLRRPTTDTGWTLKDSNQRPAANLRCEPRHRAPKQTIFIKLFQMSAEHAHCTECTVRRHLEHHADYIFSCSGINDINTAPHF